MYSAWRIGLAYVVAWTFGNIVGPLFWLLVAFGRIRIRGYCTLVASIRAGHLIITPNHPSLLETFLIPAMLWPHYLYSPRFFVWSVPDERLFGGFEWAYPLLRCVTVHRGDQKKATTGMRRIMRLLNGGEVFVIHPEGGRTCKGQEHRTRGGRRLRPIATSIPAIARKAGARILPMWVSMPGADKPRSVFGTSWLVICSRRPVVVSIRHSPHEMGKNDANEKLEEMILTS